MSALSRINGIWVSGCVRMVLTDATTGQPITSLTPASTGLRISTIGDNEASGTAYTGANILSIATPGTYAAPGANQCRFGVVDTTNHPGLYEFQFLNPRLTPANAASVIVSIQAPGTNLLPMSLQIDLDAQVDVYKNNGTAGSGAGIQDVNVAAIGGVTGNVTKLAAQLATQRIGTITSATYTPTQFTFECSDITDGDPYPLYINSGFEVLSGQLQGYKSTILGDQVGTSGRRFTVPALTGPTGGPWLQSGDQILIG
jgi:hypothetical protein